MNPASPSVKDYMTPVPHCIAPEDSVVAARALMRRHAVRHLPVSMNGKLVGLVSERDLLLAHELAGPRKRLAVRDVMTSKPYAVRVEAPLAQVARAMSRRKLGSAVILEGNSIVGVMTSVDALRALADVLQGRSAHVAEELLSIRPPRGRTRLLAHPTRH